MAKGRKVFLTIGVVLVILLGLYVVREIFIVKYPGEVRTLWQEWTRDEPTIEERMRELKKLEKEIEELERLREEIEKFNPEKKRR